MGYRRKLLWKEKEQQETISSIWRNWKGLKQNRLRGGRRGENYVREKNRGEMRKLTWKKKGQQMIPRKPLKREGERLFKRREERRKL